MPPTNRLRRFAHRALWITALAEAVSLTSIVLFFVANAVRVQQSYLTVRPRFEFWIRAESVTAELFFGTVGFVVIPLSVVLCGVRIAHAFSGDGAPLYEGAGAKVAVGTAIVAVLLIASFVLCASLAGIGGGGMIG